MCVQSPQEKLDQYLQHERVYLQRDAYKYVRNERVAEDLVQDAVLRALQAMERGIFDTRRPIGPWFARILQRVCLQYKEHAAEPRCLSLTHAEDIESYAAADPYEPILQRSEHAPLYAAIRALPLGYQALLCAVYFEGYRRKDVAAALGRKPGYVRHNLYLARKSLRKRLILERVSAQEARLLTRLAGQAGSLSPIGRMGLHYLERSRGVCAADVAEVSR